MRRIARIKRTCKQCEQHFYVKPSRITGSRVCNFCSPQCWVDFRKACRRKIACKQCGVSFHITIGKANNGKGKFCSRECFDRYKSTTKLTKLCLYCGKQFYFHAWQIKRGKGKYCSRACHQKHRVDRDNRINKVCPTCGKGFNVLPSNPKTVCSHGCANQDQKTVRGRSHPLWKRIEVACSTCGKKLYIIPSRARCSCRHFCSKVCHAEHQKTLKGKHSCNWKGGIKPLALQIRHCETYVQWRSDVFQRDHWTCQTCDKKGKGLNAHHIRPFADIMEYYEIMSLDDALGCDALWDRDNGITLCKECHDLTKGVSNPSGSFRVEAA